MTAVHFRRVARATDDDGAIWANASGRDPGGASARAAHGAAGSSTGTAGFKNTPRTTPTAVQLSHERYLKHISVILYSSIMKYTLYTVDKDKLF